MLSHSASKLLSIHHELLAIGQLTPSWPQMKRLSICGQILILSCASGALYPNEAGELFSKLFRLVESHRHIWDSAGHLVDGFRRAAKALGGCLSSEAVFR